MVPPAKLWISALLLLCISTPIQAARPFVGFGGGLSWLRLNNNAYVLADPTVQPPFNLDRYSIGSETTYNVSLFAGYQWQDCWRYAPYTSLSLRYWHFFVNDITGHVDQYNLSEFRNYRYKMHLHTNVLDVVGKINVWQYDHFLPYVALGAGLVVSKVRDYHESPIPPVTPPRTSPQFQSRRNLDLTYSIGAGIDYQWQDCYWVTLGYEYQYLNKVKSKHGEETWGHAKLNFGSLRASNVFISLTYFMNGLT